jgi:hypothetical protein
MSLTQGDVLTFCDLLAKQRGITTTFKGIAAGSAIIAGAGIAGGVVGGPIGMAIGGIVGSISAGWLYFKKFKSLREVIFKDLTEAERRELAADVWAVIKNSKPAISAVSADVLLKIVLKKPDLENAVFAVIEAFFSKRYISL